MKKDIILAGVGGQGILSIAATIGFAAVDLGLHIKQAEVHGMSQRGGDVQSHFRLSDKEIMSDLIAFGKADMIISVEPMESLRYLPMLAPDGWLITSTDPYINISNYPDIDQVVAEVKKFKNHIALPADSIAKDINSPKSANIVVLGAASPFVGIETGMLEKAIQKLFRSKGEEVVEGNIRALHAGLEFSKQYKG
jgi:indolepyruvate ferredoxin oxidoreductase, beta subunit